MSTPLPIVENLTLNGILVPFIGLLFWSIPPNLTLPSFVLTKTYQEFGFITNLEEISFGEYVDLENNLLKWEDYHKAMAVMYRPIVEKHGDKYKIEPYVSSANYAEVMEYAPLDICLAAKLFFWNLEKELLQATLHYLEREIMKSKKLKTSLAKELNLASNGDGINQYMQSLRETSLDLMTLPSFNLQQHLPSLLSKNRN